MEQEAQTSSLETQSNVTPAAEAPQANAAPVTDSGRTEFEEVPPGQEQVPPPWQPDFKFKAAGKEHEIPELYRGLIKDEKTLEEVRRLHEKAYGVDSLVQSRDSLKKHISELQPVLQEYDTVTKNFEKLSFFVQNGDFDSFFKSLQIPENRIYDWVRQKIELMDAPPEVRQQYERNRQLTQAQWEKEQELERYRSQAQEFEQHQALNTIAGAVEQLAGDVAQAYDSKLGEGAFLDYVINKGVQISQAMGGKEPPLEAVIGLVKEEMSRLGLTSGTPTAPQMQGQAPLGTPNAPKQKPTIPVVPAGGQSPVKQKIKTMDDLKKAAAAMGD